jgi:replicative DNA helicase
MTDKPHLYSQDAEEALVGSAIKDPGVLVECPLQASDFFVRSCGTVWCILMEMQRQKKAVDFLTVAENLNAQGELAGIGGPAFLTKCVDQGSSYNALEYTSIIHDYAIRRKAIQSANDLAKVALDMDTPVIQGVSKITLDLANAGLQSTATKKFLDFATEVVDEATRSSEHPQNIWGIQTGFHELDEWLGGWQTGEVLHLAGEPGVGKSRMALQFAANAASVRCGSVPTIIYSLEMSGMAMARRGISAMSQVNTRFFHTGQINPEEWTRVFDSLDKTSRMPLWLNDNSSMTIYDIRSDLASMVAQYGVKMAVIDYLYLVKGMDSRDDNERIARLSGEIKRIARDLNVFIISVDSVVKAGMDAGGNGRSMKSQIRGSGQLIHDADLIAFVEKETADPSLIKLVFVKTRDVAGTQYSFNLHQHSAFPLIEETQVRNVNLDAMVP